MGRLQWARIVERAASIVTSYQAAGDCTLRQIYYRLVSEGAIPHTPPAYRRLSAQLAQARRQQCFPDLIDPLREIHAAPSLVFVASERERSRIAAQAAPGQRIEVLTAELAAASPPAVLPQRDQGGLTVRQAVNRMLGLDRM